MAVFFGLAATNAAALAASVDKLRSAGVGPRQVSPVVDAPHSQGSDPHWPVEEDQPAIDYRLVVGGPFGETRQQLEALPDLGSDVQVVRLDAETCDIEPFLTPLLHLQPDATVPQLEGTVFENSVPDRPLWMGILNITPDSFSDGARWANMAQLEATVDGWLEAGVHFIDIGAESTRPNAAIIDPEVEWQRLKPVLHVLEGLLAPRQLPPLLSLDSRNATTLKRGLDAGIDVFNDVSGLEHPDIVDLVRSVEVPVIAMHAMTVPVEATEVLSNDVSPVVHIEQWLDRKLNQWDDEGIDLRRVIIDPGIGFGKTPSQSLELLANVRRLRSHGQRVLIGHSRKSFMNGFAGQPAPERDPETVGISLELARQGADIIRVHDPVLHLRAHRAAQQISSRRRED